MAPFLIFGRHSTGNVSGSLDEDMDSNQQRLFSHLEGAQNAPL